jgi:hypothetical protein
MKKAVSMMLFAMLIFSTVLIAAPITKCEDEEDPVRPFLFVNGTWTSFTHPPGYNFGEVPCSTEWLTFTVNVTWFQPPKYDPPKWPLVTTNVVMTSNISGTVFSPSTFTLNNYDHQYEMVNVSVPIAGLGPNTYYAWIWPVADDVADNPMYFYFTKVPCNTQPQATISGVKFHDVNANGIRDIGEEGLGGWTIKLWKFDGNDWELVDETTTDSEGDYIFKVNEDGHYNVTEVLKSGWMQTAPAGGCHEIDVSLGDTITDLDFGNIKLGSISGAKFYDANVNGEWDDGEPPIKGWKVHLTGTNILGDTIEDCAFTDADGKFVFKDLLPGTYTVEEVFPSGTWVNTTDTSFSHELEEGEDFVGPDFGNVCLMPGTGGKTLGFWSNKNGQALISPSDVDALNALNLYRLNGYPPFSSDISTAKTQIKNYLLSATAVDMRWMLSAQLIATKLNVLHGFLSGSTMVYVGPSTYVPSGFISINDIMANANTAFSGTEYWKNLLDELNNNRLPFVCPGPCSIEYPTP